MASRRKKVKEEPQPISIIQEDIQDEEQQSTPISIIQDDIQDKEEQKPAPILEEPQSTPVSEEQKQIKYPIGTVVYISKNADADLNGFKLFPQYKKYNYTVEAYEADTGVYTLRKLNLSLRLPESLIIAPNERASDMINRRQF